MSLRPAILAGALSLTSACGSASPSEVRVAEVDATVAVPCPTSGRTAPPAPYRALDDPTLPADLVSKARAALECDWGQYGSDYDCAGYADWSSAVTSIEGGPAPAILFALLRDPDVRVRWLALAATGIAFTNADAVQIGAVLSLLETESVPLIATPLAEIVAGADIEGFGLAKRVETFLANTPLFEARERFAALMLPRSQTPLVFRLTVALAKDHNSSVASSAMDAIANHGAPFGVQACDVLGASLESDNTLLFGSAAFGVVNLSCESYYDAFVVAFDRESAKSYPSIYRTADAAERFCKSSQATADQRAMLAHGAAAILKNARSTGARTQAPKVLAACDPVEGLRMLKATASSDPDGRVRDAAQKQVDALTPAASQGKKHP
ncbi:MAG: hypothetical protein U0271_41975 [Polyangiaceae bacterium]